MSRVGRSPIAVPGGVEVSLSGQTIKVKGPKGELTRPIRPEMKVNIQGSEITVERPSDEPKMRSLHGLTRSLIDNMVQGVSRGFERRLELQGVGYRAAKAGTKLSLSLGVSHPVEVDPPKGIEIEVPAATQIVVRGADREAVGELAAKIRALRPPEPYQGKGIRYEGERVRRKVGKTGKK